MQRMKWSIGGSPSVSGVGKMQVVNANKTKEMISDFQKIIVTLYTPLQVHGETVKELGKVKLLSKGISLVSDLLGRKEKVATELC